MCENAGEATLSGSTSSAEDSPVNRSRVPANEKGQPTVDGSGQSSTGLFASLNPDGSWRKTSRGYCQLMMDGSSEEFCETWPRAGTMRNGTAYLRRPLAPLTGGTGSGLLPTPAASEWTSNVGGSQGRVGPVRYSLTGMARYGMWPTPTSKQNQHCPSMRSRGSACRRMADEVGTGRLSPGFVEWLMGFPKSFTKVNDHEARHGQEASTASVSESEEMPGVRSDEAEAIREASSRLLEAAGSGNPLPDVPRESGPSGRAKESQGGTVVRDLRRDVHIQAQQQQDVLVEVLSLAGCPERKQEVEGAFTEEELYELRNRIRIAKIKGGNLLSVLWEQARMGEAEGSPWAAGEWPGQPRVEAVAPRRAVRLRALGNAIVPQIAEWLGRRIVEVDRQNDG